MAETAEPSCLNVGVIVDDVVASTYIHDFIRKASAEPDLQVTHLFIQKGTVSEKGKARRLVELLTTAEIRHLPRRALFLLVRIFEERLLRRGLHKDHFDVRSLAALVPEKVEVWPEFSGGGAVYRYAGSELAKFASAKTDVLLHFGTGILRGDVLNAAPFGIIAFHHGDNLTNRGGPAGFWEVYEKEATSGFVIQQLTEELDGGRIMFRGRMLTQYYYYLNQAKLYYRSNHYLIEVLKEIASNRALPPDDGPKPYFNRLYKSPTALQLVKYIADMISRFVFKQVSRKILKFDNRWQVAFARTGWRNLVMWRGVKIENPAGHFLADPFVINEGGRDFCFVEDFDYAANKGVISVYELQEKTAQRIGEALVEPFHLSFPYLFRYDGRIYMCPESFNSKDIRVYESTDFPTGWKLSSVLMRDVSAADTIIFEKDGRWWMFTNIDPTDTDDHCFELSIFYADSPLSEHWTPHPKNPVFCDASRARNGGLLTSDGSLYRVCQNHAFDTYGTGLSINRIMKLTPEEYLEEPFADIEPGFFDGIRGCHHLDSTGDVTVFDFTKFGGTRN